MNIYIPSDFKPNESVTELKGKLSGNVKSFVIENGDIIQFSRDSYIKVTSVEHSKEGEVTGSAKPVKCFRMWEHTGWGNTISFLNVADRTITGFLPPDNTINPDDLLIISLHDNDFGLFEVVEVEHFTNLHDMFFGKVKDIGTVEGDVL